MKALKLLTVFIILLVIMGGIIFWQRNSSLILNKYVDNFQDTDKKEYRAGTGKVVVVDIEKNQEITSIDLSAMEESFIIKFYPHDITMTDDKKQVWVTASAQQEQIQAITKELVEKTKRDQHVMMATDQIIVIDTTTDKIINRIPIGVRLDLADLIITPDNRYAYVTAEAGNAIYKIDTSTHKVDLIQLPPESKPHQLAFATDGTKLYARNSANKNTFLISIKTNEIKSQEDGEDIRSLNWSQH